MSTTPPVTTRPAAVVEEARASVGELADVMWAAKRPEELLEMVRAAEALKSTLEAIELLVINEIECHQRRRDRRLGLDS